MWLVRSDENGLGQKRQANNPMVTSTNPGCPVPENWLPECCRAEGGCAGPAGPQCNGAEYHAILQTDGSFHTAPQMVHSGCCYKAPLYWAVMWKSSLLKTHLLQTLQVAPVQTHTGLPSLPPGCIGVPAPSSLPTRGLCASFVSLSPQRLQGERMEVTTARIVMNMYYW